MIVEAFSGERKCLLVLSVEKKKLQVNLIRTLGFWADACVWQNHDLYMWIFISLFWVTEPGTDSEPVT